MKPTSLLVLLLPACLTTFAAAQVSIPVNPRATYLRINNDASALPAPAVPLVALGVTVGDWLNITTTGAYSNNGSGDNTRNLMCVFSSSPTLLISSTGVVNRVPGAITAGANFNPGPTYYSQLTTDIPQDFIVTRHGWANGTLVKVPAGATHVFMSVFNHTGNQYFSNNSDANGDYFAVFTPVAPATLQGTAEHCELRTGVSGASTAIPDVKQASPFSTLSVDLAQRWGESTGQIFLIAANIYNTGGAPPVGPLPGFHIGLDFVVVQVGIMTTAPGLWSFFVPPAHAGTTLLLQGFFLTDTARNGLLSATDAHRIELQ